ncbi:MAG: phosphatase PAP2 family protein [Planctomycetota bacterium]
MRSALPAGPVPARTGLGLIDGCHVALLAVLAPIAVAGVRDAASWLRLAAFWVPALLLVAGNVALRRRDPGRARDLALFATPVLTLFLLFESLFVLIPAVRAVRYDDVLAAADRWLLGVDATLWMEQWNRPWLDDFFFVVYMLYFPMPLVTLGWLFARRRFRDLEQAVFVFLACYYPSYLLYIAVPTAGPHVWFAAAHTVPLDGVWLAQPIHALHAFLEPSKVDAFPSVHGAILLTTMFTAWRFQRWLFWAYVPLALAILVSLVYTRNHYVVDVLAGAGIAVVTALAAHRIWPALHPRCVPHFGRTEPV